jgi:hypothetical protein
MLTKHQHIPVGFVMDIPKEEAAAWTNGERGKSRTHLQRKQRVNKN